jgi:sec-independent protein translocase protein TatC
MLISIIITLIILLNYFEEIYEIFMNPIMQLKYKKIEGFIYTDVTELFYTNMEICLKFNILLHMPILYLHVWLFMKTSLNNYQKWHLYKLLKYSLLLYIFSIIFAIYLLIPLSWNFFYYDEVMNISIEPRISLFINFILKIIIFSLLIFQIPIICFYGLYYEIYNISIVSKNKSYILMDLLLMVSLTSPADMVSFLLLLLPLLLFYEMSIWVYLYDTQYRKRLKL